MFGCRNQGNHTFPKDQIVRKLWEAAIPTRDNNMYIAKKYSKICPAHFKPQDFIKYGRFSGLVNTRRILKKGIVPSIFQCTKSEDVKSKQRLERAEVGMVTLELEVEKKEVFVKEEPPCEYLVSEDASSLYDVHVAKDEDVDGTNINSCGYQLATTSADGPTSRQRTLSYRKYSKEKTHLQNM